MCGFQWGGGSEFFLVGVERGKLLLTSLFFLFELDLWIWIGQ